MRNAAQWPRQARTRIAHARRWINSRWHPASAAKFVACLPVFGYVLIGGKFLRQHRAAGLDRLLVPLPRLRGGWGWGQTEPIEKDSDHFQQARPQSPTPRGALIRCPEANPSTYREGVSPIRRMLIRRMIYTVIGGYILNIEGIDAFQAADIESVLIGIGPSLVVGIDAAIRAEIVLRRAGIELIEFQVLRAFDDAYAAQRHRSDDSSLAPANGAIASPGIHDAIGKIQFQLNRTAVTCCTMFSAYRYSTHCLEHV